jgi:broad specificity phosphatase PhoE
MPQPDGAPRTIILMRHGETVWNRERRVMGDSDVPLSSEGRRQCRCVAALLGGLGVDAVVSSPLVRAAESAEIVAKELGLAVTPDPDLSEVRFGRWQGKTYREIVDDPDYAGYVADPVKTPTPGGETIADVQRRGLASLSRHRERSRVLYVSHGDVIRSLVCHLLHMPLAEFRRIRIDNCGLTAAREVAGHVEVKFVNTLADPDRSWESVHWSRGS